MRISTLAGLLMVSSVLAQTSSAEVISQSQATQRQWLSCAAGAAAGGVLANSASSILGSKLGKNFGQKEKMVVTGLGAAAGCALAAKFTAGDNENVQAAEQEAITSGQSSKTWESESGETITVESSAEPVQIAEAPNAECKSVTTAYSVGRRRGMSSSQQVYCADQNGEYKEAGLVL